jgi:hypothetical protein
MSIFREKERLFYSLKKPQIRSEFQLNLWIEISFLWADILKLSLEANYDDYLEKKWGSSGLCVETKPILIVSSAK